MTTTVSESRTASETEWVTNRTVVFNSSHRSSSWSCRLSRVNSSRAADAGRPLLRRPAYTAPAPVS
ncbi:hypothetical protein ACWD1Y_45575, partial [Streptomyces sp. NPDC002814]